MKYKNFLSDTYRQGDDPVQIASPEDHTGSSVSGLVFDTKTSPHRVVCKGSDSSDEESQDMGNGVNLTGNTHIEKHNRPNEHSQESNEEEVPH